MGKIRTRVLGSEEVEERQKEEQKRKAQEKKAKKKAVEKKSVENQLPAEEKKEEVKKEETKAKKTEKTVVKSRGKKYQAAKKLLEKNKAYSLKEALSLLKKMKTSNFDQSVELHLNVAKTGLKGEVDLPHATGKVTRVKIVDENVLSNLEKGIIDFDILITHPSFMPKLAKFAKVLGPKGLMPNPKAGTISPTPEEVAKKFAKGLVRYKTEPKFPLIHQMIGKISLDEKALEENAIAFVTAIGLINVKKAVIKTTMSPGIKLDLTAL